MVLLLVSCAAPSGRVYRDGAPVERAPVFVTPGYTPAGAGLPEYMPVHEAPTVERGRDRRVLPPTREPGIWASDSGSKAKPKPAVILGVVVPEPTDAHAPGYTSGYCADVYNDIIDQNDLRSRSETLPLAVRRCMAAKLYDHCISSLLTQYARKNKTGELVHAYLEELKRHKRTTSDFVEKACIDKTPWPSDATYIHDGLIEVFTRSEKE